MHGLPSGLFEELKPRYNLSFVKREVTAVCHSLYNLIDFLSLYAKNGKRNMPSWTHPDKGRGLFYLILMLTLFESHLG